MSNGYFAIAIVNRADNSKKANFNFSEFGLVGNYEIRDLWQHKVIGKRKKWDGKVLSHEIKLFRLRKL